jgi:hypothetical protein
MFKFNLALSFFSLSLIMTGIFVDQFHSEDPARIELKDGGTYFGAGIIIGHNDMTLTYPECDVPEREVRQNSILFDSKGTSYKMMSEGPTGTDEVFDAFLDPGDHSVSKSFFGNFLSFYRMSIAARVFSWVALGAQSLSLIIMIWTQTTPATFLTGTPMFDQDAKQRVWGIFHHCLSLLVAICLLADICVVSLYLDLLVGRVIELSFELCNFNPGLNELDTLKLFGTFLQSYSDVNGATGALFKVAMCLIMIQFTLVFYLGIRQVRSLNSRNDSSIPINTLKQLPWYCSIWRLQFSIFFCVVGTLVNQAAALYSREAGYSLNLYFFRSIASTESGTGSTTTGSLSDFIMDQTSKFYISEAIPNNATFLGVPIVLALAFASVDPSRFLSKVMQLCGIVMFLKSFCSISTLVPVPATVISRPYCYDPPPASLWSWRSFLSRAAQCNHLMFSLPAAGSTIGIMIIMMYVRYGQAVKKAVAYTFLLLVLAGSLVTPIAARVNYSSNVFIALFIVTLLVTSQSQAFKVLFQCETGPPDFTTALSKLNFSAGEVLNDKVIPNLQECVKRLQMYRLATADAVGLRLSTEELQEMRSLYEAVGNAIKVARVAKPAEKRSSVGLMRKSTVGVPLSNTPPIKEKEIDDMITAMLEVRNHEAVAQVVVREGESRFIHETPIPISISPVSNDPQRGKQEPTGEYDKS